METSIVKKTPAYTLRAQKAYYQRLKEDPEKLKIRKEKARQYYLKKKNATTRANANSKSPDS